MRRPVWRLERWLLVALVLLAWGLRLAPALDNRFHADEALYGYWGLRILYGQDPLLLSVPVYKPPLLPYLMAGTQALLGNSELTLRFPGLAAGLLMVVLVAALAGTLYRGRRIPVIAALAMALSPFAILFSATVFPDPLMVVLGLGACVAVSRGRWGWAGVLAGLAFSAKQTGLAWAPLVVGLGWSARCAMARTAGAGHGRRLALGFALAAGMAFAWDLARVAQGATSFWALAVSGYGGLRLIWPGELWPRLHSWALLARYLFVSWFINGLLVLGLPALVWRALRCPLTRERRGDVLLASFCVLYAMVHWLWAFPAWDRYLLPLVPVLAVLLGRMVCGLADTLRGLLSRVRRSGQRRLGRYAAVIALCVLVAPLVGPAVGAAQGGYPVGGDHGAYDGIDQVAAFLRSQPDGTVVYQHWLGWHYAYYLSGAELYVAYWPTPAWLAQDVRAFGARQPRYITFPAWESSARAAHALASVGYGLQQVFSAPNRAGGLAFTVYQIVPLSGIDVSPRPE